MITRFWPSTGKILKIAIHAFLLCMTSNVAFSACPAGLAQLMEPEIVLSYIGKADLPEVNIDDLKVGPRGWIYGATEENGYMFIFDPRTRDIHIWNAGQQVPTVRENDEGDITDFCCWEEEGKLIIIATHGQPAEIYRYEIEIPESGLPRISPEHGYKVYENPRWARVASVARGTDSSGSPILLAGSTNRGELIRSDDGGRTWYEVDFLAHTEGVQSSHLKLIPNKRSTISEIHFVRGVWFLMLSRFAFLEAEATIGKYKHFLNGILYSVDGAETWKWARIQANPLLPHSLSELVEADRSSNRLPEGLYAFIGESGRRLFLTSSGRLLMTTSMNNIPEAPFGGRILYSDNGGRSWRNLYHFDKHRCVTIIEFAPGSLLVGTSDKTYTPDQTGYAHGDLYVSGDGGRTFTFCHRVVSSNKPSRYETNPFYIVGALALAKADCFVGIGTVSEGEAGQFFLARLQHLTRYLNFDQRPSPKIIDNPSGVALATLGEYSAKVDASDPEWMDLGNPHKGVLKFSPSADGIRDYLNLTDAAIPSGTCELDFAADILPDNQDDDLTRYIFISRDPDGVLVGLYIRKGYTYLLLKKADYSVRLKSHQKVTGSWHRVSFSVGRNLASLRVDGQEVQTRPLPPGWRFPSGVQERRIGRGFSGLIDNVEITPRCYYAQ